MNAANIVFVRQSGVSIGVVRYRVVEIVLVAAANILEDQLTLRKNDSSARRIAYR